MDLPKGWHLEITRSNLACIYRRDPFEFNGQPAALVSETNLGTQARFVFYEQSKIYNQITSIPGGIHHTSAYNASIAGLNLHEL